eukprot:TRINITY_DN16871_c0_g1_i1.p4 TRINITY_DN16871_c0_g1~~TRINITY_DN16871_c0_g1_i1.p4  ORF type:complete len:107 (-),score=7.36 TRINITY_DN16871_c0_g1_i1:25-345(-)
MDLHQHYIQSFYHYIRLQQYSFPIFMHLYINIYNQLIKLQRKQKAKDKIQKFKDKISKIKKIFQSYYKYEYRSQLNISSLIEEFISHSFSKDISKIKVKAGRNCQS